MHLAIDLDDVVVDFMQGVMDSFYREYGIVPEWDGQPWGDSAVAFTKHELFLESGYSSWWGWLRDREWLWAQFPAVPGAIGGVKRLRQQGHYVEALTSKPEWASHNVWKWLGKWRPAFHQVTIVQPGQEKVDWTSADLMVDDKRKTCELFAAAGRFAIHFDRTSSNLSDEGITVASSWAEVVETVKELGL